MVKSSSPRKDFGVFDFKLEEEEEDEKVESSSSSGVPTGSLMEKLRNLNQPERSSSSSLSKNHQFLECFSREADTQQMKITNAPCVLAVDRNCIHSEVKDGISELDETLNEATAVISDEDESVKTSCTSTSSDFEENEGSLADPTSNPRSLGWEMENINVAVVVYPDYIIYGDKYCTESQLTFCSSCIMLEGSNAYGSKEFFSSEWAIIDVTHIESQWCGVLETAFVKLCVTPNAATGAGNSYGDIVELKFAVYDCRWPEEQKRIMLLNERYKAIWRAVFDTELAREEVDDVGQNNMFSSSRYFSNFDKHFEDVVYPKGDPDAVSISKRDIELLQPETFINDTLIDFYIKYLKNKIQPEDRPRFHFFNSFFFRKLADLDKNPSSAFEGSTAFPRVRKWTRKVNLFEKDYIFIPVNFNLHWSLIVICHLGEVANSKDEELKMLPKVPCILHMDSIKGSHKGLKNLVQSYLWEEWKARQQAESSEDVSSKFLNLRFVSLELPQQENSFDCGLFLLHYVERFLEVAPVNFNPFKITKFSNFLNSDWFPPAEASLKRSLIQKLIQELLEDCAPEIPPAACNDVHGSYVFPENDNEKEDGLVFLSERHSRVKISGSTSSAVDQGIETEVSATSPLDGAVRDQGLVFRQLFQPGTTAEAEFFHERQCQLFDQSHQTTPFHRLKCAVSPIEEDVEAEQRFAYTRSGAPGSWPSDGVTVEACTTSYSSKDNSVLEPLCNPKLEFSMRLEENCNADSSPQRSSFGSQNSCDIEEDEPTPTRDFASIQQEEIEKPRLDSLENIGFVRETSASSSSEEPETFTIEDSQEIDRTAEIKENGDPLSFRENSPALLQGESGSIETRNLLGDHLRLSGNESTVKLDDENTAKLPILMPLLADDNTAKRPILMPLLDEEQTAKRRRLMPSLEEENKVVHERHGEGLSLLSTG